MGTVTDIKKNRAETRKQLQAKRKAEAAKEAALAAMMPEQRAEYDKQLANRKEREERLAHAKAQPIVPSAMLALAKREFELRMPELMDQAHQQIHINATGGHISFGLGIDKGDYRTEVIKRLRAEGWFIRDEDKDKEFTIDLDSSYDTPKTDAA